MPYSPQEKIKIGELYILINSLVSTQRRFQLHFNVRYAATKKNTIKENFRGKGSVLNHNREASGRPVSGRTGEKIEAARASVVEEPNKSYRKRFQVLLMKLY